MTITGCRLWLLMRRCHESATPILVLGDLPATSIVRMDHADQAAKRKRYDIQSLQVLAILQIR